MLLKSCGCPCVGYSSPAPVANVLGTREPLRKRCRSAYRVSTRALSVRGPSHFTGAQNLLTEPSKEGQLRPSSNRRGRSRWSGWTDRSDRTGRTSDAHRSRWSSRASNATRKTSRTPRDNSSALVETGQAYYWAEPVSRLGRPCMAVDNVSDPVHVVVENVPAGLDPAHEVAIAVEQRMQRNETLTIRMFFLDKSCCRPRA